MQKPFITVTSFFVNYFISISHIIKILLLLLLLLLLLSIIP